jgi:hypothetical protein
MHGTSTNTRRVPSASARTPSAAPGRFAFNPGASSGGPSAPGRFHPQLDLHLAALARASGQRLQRGGDIDAGRRRAVENYSWTTVAKRVHALYQELLDR